MVIDKISEDGGDITYIQHAITTKDYPVDAGGPNVYQPIFLCNDKVYNIPLYTIPLIYINRVKKSKFYAMFNVRKKINTNDPELVRLNIETEKTVIANLQHVMTMTPWFQVHIQEDILMKSVYSIDVNEKFRAKDSVYLVSSWEELSIENIN